MFVKSLLLSCTGHWEISGTDKYSNPILWVRVGFANAGRGGIGSRRNINSKTQDWYSAVRSTMFMYELYNRQRLLMEEIPSTAVHCFDFRGQGFLDGVSCEWLPGAFHARQIGFLNSRIY